MALNFRQRSFVNAYEGNATQAAIAAGYSGKTAHSAGSRLLKHVEVSQAIQEREEKEASVRAATIADRRERLAFLTAIMRDGARSDAARLKAADLLCRISGDYRPQGESFSPDSWRVQTNAPEN